MKALKYTLVSLFLFISLLCSAQQPLHHQLTINDGLPSNTVYWMLQDSRGYMWLGTENGITRYDGKEFKRYTSLDLSSRDFNSIHEDSKGNIWSHNFDNQIVRISGDSMTVFAHPTFTEQGDYMEMVLGEQDGVYVKQANKLFRYFPEEGRHEILFNKGAMTQLIAYGGLITTGNASQNYYVEYNEASGELTEHTLEKGMLEKGAYKMMRVGSDTILICNHTVVPKMMYIVKNEQIKEFDPLSHYNIKGTFYINNIKKLANGELWYCTTKGAVSVKDRKVLLPGVSVANVLKDKAGNLWISTLKDGIFIFPNLNVKIHTSLNGQLARLKPSCVTFDDKGQLFVGTEEGEVFHWNPKSRTILRKFDNEIARRVDDIVFNPKTKDVWVSGFSKFNLKGVDYKISGPALPIKEGFILPNNDIIIRPSRVSVLHYNQKNTAISPKAFFSEGWKNGASTLRSKSYQISNLHINTPVQSIFYESDKDRLWVALHKKTLLNTRSGIKEFFLKENSSFTATCFGQADDGTIWAGTSSYGFIILKNDKLHLDKRTDDFSAFGEIRKIASGEGVVWLLADNGLLVVNLAGEILHIYNESQGIISNNITDVDVMGQTAWVCTKNGLMEIEFQQRPKQAPPKVIIRGIYVAGQQVETDTSYQFTYDKNTIRIDFRALELTPDSRFSYLYRMKGIDEDWQLVGSENESVRYPGLSPDNYIFEIKTSSADNIQSSVRRIRFNINPPLWQRAWFIVGMLILTGSFLYARYRAHLQRIQQQNEYEQKARTNQLTVLRTQMNPHFLFNALNSIQEFIILNEKRLANEYLGKFAQLMRTYLDHSSKDWIPLLEEISALKLYLELEQLRFEDIKIDLQIFPELIHEEILIPPLFVQPYVENAFKHGLLHKKKDRKLNIYFQNNKNHFLEVIIEDNGVGRKKALEIKNSRFNKNASFSTTANQQRLELLNYNTNKPIQVNIIDLYENELATGTKVVIHIPIN